MSDPSQKGAAAEPSAEHPLSRLLYGRFRTPAGKQVGLALLALTCAGLATASVLLGRKGHFGFDGWPVFSGLFGFAAFSAAVLSGWPLGALLRRPETYYPEDREPEPEAGGGDGHA